MTTTHTDKEPTDRAEEIANTISRHLRQKVAHLEGEACALAAIVLDMVDTYEVFDDEITRAYNEAKRPGEDGGDSHLLLDVMGKLGYETVTEVWRGLVELLTDAIGGPAMKPGEALAKLRQHALDHRLEIGEPMLMVTGGDEIPATPEVLRARRIELSDDEDEGSRIWLEADPDSGPQLMFSQNGNIVMAMGVRGGPQVSEPDPYLWMDRGGETTERPLGVDDQDRLAILESQVARMVAALGALRMLIGPPQPTVPAEDARG